MYSDGNISSTIPNQDGFNRNTSAVKYIIEIPLVDMVKSKGSFTVLYNHIPLTSD